MENTVEERILEVGRASGVLCPNGQAHPPQLQNAKRELAQAALSGTGAKNLKLTMADIMSALRRLRRVHADAAELFQRSE